jgi:phosphoribosylformylglycinamidine synthase
VGAPSSWGTHLGQSVYMRDIHGRTDGPPPFVDLAHERRVGDFVRDLIRNGLTTAVHDCSSGGLALAVAEMAMASGIGASINALNDANPVAVFYGEDQGRYVVTVERSDLDEVLELAEARGVFAPFIGTTGGATVKLGDARAVAIEQLQKAHESWFPDFMAGELPATE